MTLPWWYSPAYALINWCEATVGLLCTGRYYPGWAMRFACWATLRSLKKG